MANVATRKTKIIDTLLLGSALWLIGYVASLILYGFVPKALLGWILFVIFTPVTAYISFLRFRHRKESVRYYLAVAISWAAVAMLFDYLFIVTAFGVPDYYAADVFAYYITAFAVPLLIGYRYGRG